MSGYFLSLATLVVAGNIARYGCLPDDAVRLLNDIANEENQ